METLAVKFNKIFIVQSLNECQRAIAGDLIFSEINELLTEQNDKILTVDLIDVYESRDFFTALQNIRDKITHGVYPYLHFEMHGSVEGLQLLSGEPLAWSDLRKLIQEINIRCENNLYVSLSTCYGAEFMKLFKPLEPSPFFGYIGPTEGVQFGDALTTYASYFKSLLTEYSFTKAIIELRNCIPGNKDKYQIINCLQYFAVYYELYKQKHGFDEYKNLYWMKKKMLNDLALQNPGKSKSSLKPYVEQFKFQDREKSFFKEARKVFLHGREYPKLEIK